MKAVCHSRFRGNNNGVEMSEKKLRQIFDSWAERGEDKYANKQWLLSKYEVVEGIEWPKEKVEIAIKTIKAALALNSADSLLDLGCGGGWITNSLIPHAKDVFGCDISIAMLNVAQKLMPKQKFICGEIGKLPFKSEQFDKILCYFVFINLTNDEYLRQAILEMMRVIKKGGRVVIGQLPDKAGSKDYDQAKEKYLEYCQKHYSLGESFEETHVPPLRLFDRGQWSDFFREQKISYEMRSSFNPFYCCDQPAQVDWRFDIILTKS